MARCAVILGMLATVLVACGNGSDDDHDNLAACGNNRLDSGEECDDGNLVDEDACTAVCRRARCGDGAIQAGIEQCEGNVLPSTCNALGAAQGEGGRIYPGCTSGCQFDLSLCGARYTPTPTFTITPAATATASASATATPQPSGEATHTPTVTPTPTVAPCGNALLEPNERDEICPTPIPDRQCAEPCDDCPADCVPRECPLVDEPPTAAFDVLFQPPLGEQPTTVTVLIPYRTNLVSLPGTGTEPAVRRNLRIPMPLPSALGANDFEIAVRIVLGRNDPLPATLFSVVFEVCDGAPAPLAADLLCIVEGCAAGGTPVTGCGCSIVESAP
jgi:cysteine-rich repeat protein